MKRWLLLFLLALPLFVIGQGTPVSPTGPKETRSYIEPSTSRLWLYANAHWYRIVDSAYIKQIAGGGFTNPMTTAGDIITGGASGVPTRLGIGSANTIPSVNTAGTGLEYRNLATQGGLGGSLTTGQIALFLQETIVTATDANIPFINSGNLYELPTITANRTINVASASSFRGQKATFWNQNTSGNIWTFTGDAVVNSAGASALTIPSASVVTLESDGTQWVATVNSTVTSLSNGLTVDNGVGKLGGNISEGTTINNDSHDLIIGDQNFNKATIEIDNTGAGAMTLSQGAGPFTTIDQRSAQVAIQRHFGSKTTTISIDGISSGIQIQDDNHVGLFSNSIYPKISGGQYAQYKKVDSIAKAKADSVKGTIGATIYTANGSLTSNRAVNLNGFTLGFSGNINVNGGTLGRGSGADTSSFGFNAFSASSYPAGKFNVYFGGRALQSNTTGTQNTAVGISAMAANTTGGLNVSVGTSALTANISGGSNVAIGTNSLSLNTTGSFNTAVGRNSLSVNTTASFNSGFGFNSLELNTTGFRNAAFGSNSLFGNTTGHNNTAVGDSTLRFLITGSNNTALGSSAGVSALGNGNVFLGYNAGFSETGSNTLYIANSSTNQPLIKGDFSEKTVLINGVIGASSTPLGTAGTDSIVVKRGNNFYAISPTGGGSGTVTSITPGYGFTSSTPITTTGTLTIDTTSQIASTVNHPTFAQLQTKVNNYLLTTTAASTYQPIGTYLTPSSTNVVTNKDLTSGTNTFPTFTAAAGTLTGTTLNSTVVTSSLTSANLSALTATDASLTFSGSYNGNTARTIGINFAQTPTWTGLHTFNATNIVTTSTPQLIVGTATAATLAVPVQYSGLLTQTGLAWNPTAAASQDVNFGWEVEPASANPVNGQYVLRSWVNGGAKSSLLNVTNTGQLTSSNLIVLNQGFFGNTPTDVLSISNPATPSVGTPISRSGRISQLAGLWSTKVTAAANYTKYGFDIGGVSSNAPVGSYDITSGLGTTTSPTLTKIYSLFHYGGISLFPQAATINAWANNTETSATGAILNIGGATLTDGITAASTTLTYGFGSSISQPTFAATNTGEVITNAATLHVGPAPAAGTNVTITNGYSLLVDGNVNVQNLTASQPVFTDANKNLVSSTLLTPTLVSSAAGTLTLATGIDYEFTGTTTTWTLPAASASLNGRAYQITIKNAGSGSITLNSASGSQIYDTSLVASLTITAGSAVTLMPDGTRFLRE